MPARDAPLTGSCACGTVAFEVTAPFETAGYCHCKRCQRRTGALWSVNGMVPAEGFAFVRGSEAVRRWEPPDGLPKAFCGVCGGHLFSDAGTTLAVRFGALDGDPGIRPQWHQWLESAPAWDVIPDDGLPRFPQRRATTCR
jgi:hypothetical protein